eukprot:808363_1
MSSAGGRSSVQGRDMRGASYMDQYDSANTGYEAGKSGKGDLAGCAKCTKHTLFAVNFIMLLIGVALIVVVFFVKNSSDTGDVTIGLSDTVVWVAVASGALIIIVSFLGCVGATTHSKCILITFMVMLILCLLIEITGIIMIFADKDLVKDNFKKQWDKLSAQQKTQYETDNNCQGFDGTGGCYTKMEDSLKSNMMIIGGITIGVFIYQLIMTIFACCLCTKISQSKRSGGGGGDSYSV